MVGYSFLAAILTSPPRVCLRAFPPRRMGGGRYVTTALTKPWSWASQRLTRPGIAFLGGGMVAVVMLVVVVMDDMLGVRKE